MRNLSLIAAIGYSNELGIENRLIWHISEDLAFYKRTTMGKNIIMGRKTLESMPPKALLGRNPIVLTSKDIDINLDVVCFKDINTLLNYITNTKNEEFMVIGGASIYEQFLPYVDTMYLTEIQENEEADAFFPVFDPDDWDVKLIGDFIDNDIPYIRNKYTRKKTKRRK